MRRFAFNHAEMAIRRKPIVPTIPRSVQVIPPSPEIQTSRKLVAAKRLSSADIAMELRLADLASARSAQSPPPISDGKIQSKKAAQELWPRIAGTAADGAPFPGSATRRGGFFCHGGDSWNNDSSKLRSAYRNDSLIFRLACRALARPGMESHPEPESSPPFQTDMQSALPRQKLMILFI